MDWIIGLLGVSLPCLLVALLLWHLLRTLKRR